MSNSVPEHPYVHTGPIHSVAVCTKLFRKLPINKQRRRNHSRHQRGYIWLHINCSSACLCNGAEHIHGQRSPLLQLTLGKPIMTISPASYFIYGVQPVHFGLNVRVEYQTQQPTFLCGHGSCVPGHDCLHTSLRTMPGHAWTMPETTFSSGCPSMKQLSGLWGQACEGLCPGPLAWKHPWMMRGDKLSKNFCLFRWWTPRFPWRSFLILSSHLNAPSQPPHTPTTQTICDMFEHVWHGLPSDVWWMSEQTNDDLILWIFVRSPCLKGA